MKTKTKIWILAVAALLAVVVVLAGVKVLQIRAMIAAGKSFTQPPESVTSAKVQELEWQDSRQAVGTLVAVRAVMLGAELAGTVREVSFDSGASVKRGALLVKLDTSTEEAQLAAAQADAALARDQLTRAKNLRQGGANTPADLDAAAARAKQAEASVQTLEATIAKKSIRAPFDGRIAIRQVELGQVVSPGTTLASLQSVSPIHADFWLPQQALVDLHSGQKTRLDVDTFPGVAWEGEITTVNPEVDVATRNVRVRATFPNADGKLRPGMYARVEVISPGKRHALVIPVTAVVFAPYGDSVFVIQERKEQAAPATDAGGKGKVAAAEAKSPPGEAPGKPALVAQQRFVRLGERRGDFVEVLSGLSATDRVVGNGAFKLRSGAAVALNDALAPPASLDPKPTDR